MPDTQEHVRHGPLTEAEFAERRGRLGIDPGLEMKNPARSSRRGSDRWIFENPHLPVRRAGIGFATEDAGVENPASEAEHHRNSEPTAVVSELGHERHVHHPADEVPEADRRFAEVVRPTPAAEGKDSLALWHRRIERQRRHDARKELAPDSLGDDGQV